MTERTRQRRRRSAAMRRARLRKHHVEYVDPFLVWLRSEGLCALCGEGIDITLPTRHPRSLTRDHVVPVARGGEHSYANMQAAHRGCNSRKAGRRHGR